MRVTVDTHPGVEIIEPTFEVVKTVDCPASETFQPHVIIHGQEGVNIYHELPNQPYVNGTWSDEDVHTSINAYFNSISYE